MKLWFTAVLVFFFTFLLILSVQPLYAERLEPANFHYLGAFKLPGGDVRPKTFAYGGNAMTFSPSGDSKGKVDGFIGSLFITGHERMAYGELPDGNQIAQVSIPKPVKSKNLKKLPTAKFIQNFHNAAKGMFDSLDEIPRVGMVYLNNPKTGPVIHICWGQHFQDTPETQVPSHGWISPNLSSPNPQGTWYIGHQSFYSINDYMFEIPKSWADRYLGGEYLATGRYRDGGWSGQGPSLFAYCPWDRKTGKPLPPGTHLKETTLLLYANSRETEDVVHRSLKGYQHADEWTGGAWITTPSGKTAVLFAGTKGTGEKYWYGWINPHGSQYPCVETAFIGQFPVCRLANGVPCPSKDLKGCKNHSDYRGWWSSKFNARFVLYDPEDFAKVATSKMKPSEPQPYAYLDIDKYLLFNPSKIEQDMLGTGVQRIYRIGAIAYDRENNLLYVLELFADEAKPIVHVWSIK